MGMPLLLVTFGLYDAPLTLTLTLAHPNPSPSVNEVETIAGNV